MSFILPCTPPKQPVYAIDNEGKEEYAEENPWVHMQFDKAEQASPFISSRRQWAATCCACVDKATKTLKIVISAFLHSLLLCLATTACSRDTQARHSANLMLHPALQDEQAAAEQDAGPKQQEQQVDPTKVLEAFASARVRGLHGVARQQPPGGAPAQDSTPQRCQSASLVDDHGLIIRQQHLSTVLPGMHSSSTTAAGSHEPKELPHPPVNGQGLAISGHSPHAIMTPCAWSLITWRTSTLPDYAFPAG
jgi:hypothetical protein